MEGNNQGAVHVIMKRKYRQYMNRKGGFNRPLDFVAWVVQVEVVLVVEVKSSELLQMSSPLLPYTNFWRALLVVFICWTASVVVFDNFQKDGRLKSEWQPVWEVVILSAELNVIITISKKLGWLFILLSSYVYHSSSIKIWFLYNNENSSRTQKWKRKKVCYSLFRAKVRDQCAGREISFIIFVVC